MEVTKLLEAEMRVRDDRWSLQFLLDKLQHSQLLAVKYQSQLENTSIYCVLTNKEV